MSSVTHLKPIDKLLKRGAPPQALDAEFNDLRGNYQLYLKGQLGIADYCFIHELVMWGDALFSEDELLLMIRDLVKLGASVHTPDRRGYTALHVAGTPRVAQYLLVLGADINALSASGATPLDAAAGLQRHAVAALLLGCGGKWAHELKEGEK